MSSPACATGFALSMAASSPIGARRRSSLTTSCVVVAASRAAKSVCFRHRRVEHPFCRKGGPIASDSWSFQLDCRNARALVLPPVRTTYERRAITGVRRSALNGTSADRATIIAVAFRSSRSE